MLESHSSGVLKVRGFRKNNSLFEFDTADRESKIPTRIFDPFYTPDHAKEQDWGSASVRHHQGTCGEMALRVPGRGVVRHRNPIACQREQQDIRRGGTRHAGVAAERAVLLVEDEEGGVGIRARLLVGAGAMLLPRLKHGRTKQHLQNGSFDVMVMNGRMPGGPSARKCIADVENSAGMKKRLLLTFSPSRRETRRFLQDKNVPSLAKPFEVADLISQVRGCCRGKMRRMRRLRRPGRARRKPGLCERRVVPSRTLQIGQRVYATPSDCRAAFGACVQVLRFYRADPAAAAFSSAASSLCSSPQHLRNQVGHFKRLRQRRHILILKESPRLRVRDG